VRKEKAIAKKKKGKRNEKKKILANKK